MTPTPLDRFLQLDFNCLTHAIENGQLVITFETNRQAINTSALLQRLAKSIAHYTPEDYIAPFMKYLMFCVEGSVLTIVNRDKSPEIHAQRKALEML